MLLWSSILAGCNESTFAPIIERCPIYLSFRIAPFVPETIAMGPRIAKARSMCQVRLIGPSRVMALDTIITAWPVVLQHSMHSNTSDHRCKPASTSYQRANMQDRDRLSAAQPERQTKSNQKKKNQNRTGHHHLGRKQQSSKRQKELSSNRSTKRAS